MSGFTPAAGDTFFSPSDQIAATQTSHLNGDGTLTVTKDENASQGAVPITEVSINSVTLDVQTSVTFGGPAENVIATEYNVTLQTGLGPETLDAFLLGLNTDQTQALIASPSVPGESLIISNDVQNFGTGLSDTFVPAFTLACFASGARIRTPDRDVAVEELRQGDHVLTASGGSAPVMWLGHRTVDCQRHPRPQEVWPVRIAAGAFGPAQPVRDLMLSPDHAVFVDGALVPVRHLVNGSTITQRKVDEITYWHVELPAHGVLLAEGLACESYLDTGNRSAFEDRGLRFEVQSYSVRVSA